MLTELRSEILDGVNNLIPEANEPSLLAMLVDKLLADVASYTHLKAEEIPVELKPSLVLAVYGWCQSTDIFGTNDDDSPVSKITEGDKSVEFAVTAKKVQQVSEADLLTDKLKGTLNRYRKLVFD